MATYSSPVLRQVGAAIRALLVLTVILGLAYPLAMTGIAQAVFAGQADGSLVRHDGRVVGSALIGQPFTGAHGNLLPEYFQPRPSASGYDPLASGASNLGPTNPVLVAQVRARRARVAGQDGIAPHAVAPDAVTASGSGLDPQISTQYAAQQVQRVARARGLDPARVRVLVRQNTQGRALGVLGEPAVNVLELNLALDRLGPASADARAPRLGHARR
jgi:potassium-transporting ATPase KdpC subunit